MTEPATNLGRRIAELSRDLIGLELEGFESGLERGLGVVASLFGADRVFLFDTSRLGRVHVYAWAATDVDARVPPTAGEEVAGFRWSLPRLLAGEVVEVSDVDGMPAEAEAERADLRQRGVRVLLGIPVRSEHVFLGYLSLEYVRSTRVFDDEEVHLLRLVADLFSAAVRRRNAEVDLSRRLEVERLLVDLSRRFVELGTAGFDRGVRDCLSVASQIAGADRCRLVTIDDGSATGVRTYTWAGEKVSSNDTAYQRDVGDRFPWAATKLQKGEDVYIADVGMIPSGAVAEHVHMNLRGARSVLAVPVRGTSRLIGALVFESRSDVEVWPEEDRGPLYVVAEILGSTIERRSAEIALAASQSQLAQSQKMEAIGRMAGGIAHDFNNLLTVILGNVGGLLEREDADRVWREDLDEIRGAAERAAALTRRLLAFSTRQMVAPRRVDLNRVVSGLEGMLRRLIGEDVDLRFVLEEGLEVIQADPSELEQVIVNLVVNARAAVPGGGRIAVRTARERLDPERANRLGLEGVPSAIALTVEDDGCGMDDDTRSRIFEPFFTTREPGKGSGLGLSIVYNVVAGCGGAIDVTSAPGEGTRFELFFPAREGGETLVAPALPVSGAVSGTVLLVEDEVALRRLSRRMLRAEGFDVLEAGDGKEALEVAERHRGPIDLLLTDVVMPRMGGAELWRTLGKERPELRVLFMSGYPRERDDTPIDLADGAFLPKPFTRSAMLSAVRTALAGAKRSRQSRSATSQTPPR